MCGLFDGWIVTAYRLQAGRAQVGSPGGGSSGGIPASGSVQDSHDGDLGN